MIASAFDASETLLGITSIKVTSSMTDDMDADKELNKHAESSSSNIYK